MQPKLKYFQNEPMTFVESIDVKPGVVCDVYTFDGSKEKDLAIVQVAPRVCSPLQRVVGGDRTTIGFVSGEGAFRVTASNGEYTEHTFKSGEHGIEMNKGDVMQWCAGQSGLVFYELYYPPYQDGRYEDLE